MTVFSNILVLCVSAGIFFLFFKHFKLQALVSTIALAPIFQMDNLTTGPPIAHKPIPIPVKCQVLLMRKFKPMGSPSNNSHQKEDPLNPQKQ